MITITPSAERGLARLLSERGADGLRLAVEKGGCAGYQYEMSLSSARPGDIEIACGEGKVFVDPESMSYLEGCTLDFAEDLTGAGFRVRNPRAARSCGCGTSFEPSR